MVFKDVARKISICFAVITALLMGVAGLAEDGAYILEKRQGLHRVGNAPAAAPDTLSVNTVDFEITEDGLGIFVLDEEGRLTYDGEAANAKESGLGQGARKKVAISRRGYAILDSLGQVTFGGGQPDLEWNAYFGWDIARDIELTPEGDGMMVLDGMGSVHIRGNAPEFTGPFFGWDIARDVELSPDGKGYYILDGYGFIHSQGPIPVFEGVDLGWDIARDLELSQSGKGFYILDGFGGLHVGGDAVPFNLPYFGWDVATDLEIAPQALGALGGYILGQSANGELTPLPGAIVMLKRIDLPVDAVRADREDTLGAENSRVIKTRADGSGAYSFPALSVGNYRVHIEYPGYEPFRDETEVVAGVEQTRDFVLTMRSTPPSAHEYGQIKGAVAEDVGMLTVYIPIPNARIQLYLTHRQVLTVRSDEQGLFEFPKVPVGVYPIVAAAKGFLPAKLMVTVQAGETAQPVFWLKKMPEQSGRIYGTVAEALENADCTAGADCIGATAPLPGAELHLIPADWPIYQNPVEGSNILPIAEDIGYHTISDEEGRYSFDDLPLGRYILLVRAEGYASAKRVVVLGGYCPEPCHEKQVDFVLHPLVQNAGMIYGNVLAASDASGALLVPLPGAVVHAIPLRDSSDPEPEMVLLVDGTAVGSATRNPTIDRCHIAVTDENGDYRFDRLPAGSYRLVVSARGYEPARREVILYFGAELEENFILYPIAHPMGRIEGFVWAATSDLAVLASMQSPTSVPGEPIMGAVVVLMPAPQAAEAQGDGPGPVSDRIRAEVGDAPQWLEDLEISRRYRTATTAADGSYAFENVPEGHYRLIAKACGFLPRRKAAAVLENQTTIVNFQLEPAPAPAVGGLVGSVTDAVTEEPIRRAVVTAWPMIVTALEDASIVPPSPRPGPVPRPYRTVTDDSGNYKFERLPAGPYRVTVRARGYEPAAAPIVIREQVTTLLDFALLPQPEPGAVVGFVRQAIADSLLEGGPIPGALVTLIPWDLAAADDVSTGLRNTEQDPAGQIFRTRTNGSGWYEFPEVPAGRYLIRVEKQHYIPAMRRIGVSSGETVRANFELRPLGAPPAGTIVGTVYALIEGGNPEPIPGAYVFLFRWRPEMDPSQLNRDEAQRFTRTDRAGEYEFENVPAGVYLELVYATGFEIDFRRVEVVAGEITQANFFLHPSDPAREGKVFGRVTQAREGEEPAPVSRVQMILFRISGDSVPMPATYIELKPSQLNRPPFQVVWTTDEGYYEFNALEEATYLLFALKEGLGHQSAWFFLAEGEQKEVNFHFLTGTDPGTVEGVCYASGTGTDVESESGRFLSGVLITLVSDNGVVFDAVSGRGGRFLISDVPAGIYEMRGRLEGYQLYQAEVEVKAGETTQVRLVLEPEAAPEQAKIYGVVQTPAPDESMIVSARVPVADATVTAVPGFQWPFSVPLPWTVTDENGKYSLMLYPGEYQIRVEKAGFAAAEILVVLEAGKAVRKDFLLKSETSNEGVVFGKVYRSNTRTNGATDAIPGATVTAIPQMPWPLSVPAPRTMTNEEGHYRLTLPKGPYVVRVEKEGFQTRWEPLWIDADRAKEMNFLLSSGSGEGLAIVTGLVWAASQDGSESIPVVNARVGFTGDHIRSFRAIETRTDEHGRFFILLPEDTFTVVITKDGFLPWEDRVEAVAGQLNYLEYELIRPELIPVSISTAE